MGKESVAFLEIEHKFVVDDSFDLDDFCARCRKLGPVNEKALGVKDTYYVPANESDLIYRHRLDKEIQQLTLKSRGGDNEVRTEINLDLGAGRSQASGVEAWMGAIGALPGFGIQKHIHVFDFPDCEVVHYEASHAGRSICCVEFEAKKVNDEEAGLAVLIRYERLLGFENLEREKINLFDLLVTRNS